MKRVVFTHKMGAQTLEALLHASLEQRVPSRTVLRESQFDREEAHRLQVLQAVNEESLHRLHSSIGQLSCSPNRSKERR